MGTYRRYILYIGIWTVLLALPCCILQAQDKPFTVVIDAGHGGHDPGALGRISKEKTINLNVSLRLGRLIEQGCPDVKVIYTRRKDVFIPLDRRAEIANNAKADLFISIHTNSVAGSRSPRGASTWTLGLAKSDANLEVAKRENSVILYEDDYRTRYAGFDPNSAESYIIFEFMQDKYMSQSVHLASLVQKEFKQTGGRVDRGVHQAGFLVLKASAMPSILVELGFISNPTEERYLNSEQGINTLARSIYRAFLTYKQEQQQRQQNPGIPSSGKVTEERSVLIFKVQILSSRQAISLNDKRFKGLKQVERYQEDGLYKYTCHPSSDYRQVQQAKQELASRFQGAFIVAFKNGRKVDTRQAIQEYNHL